MIGIKDIGIYIPDVRVNNLNKAERHQVKKDFIENKVGIVSVARKEPQQLSSDLCVFAYQDLQEKEESLDDNEIDFLCVCTQNEDYQLPQTSAIVQAKLGLSTQVAAFDISLGCSGYVYALHISKDFMEANGLERGLLFTSDPYSDIVDPNDKNTDLIFGDAATVTLLSNDPKFEIGKGAFVTDGYAYEKLIKRKDEYLYMDGRGIFNFVMRSTPGVVESCLQKNDAVKEDVDIFIFHQASKYVIENLARRMKIAEDKVPFTIAEYGNTVSSSIPIIFERYLEMTSEQKIIICGFGVGLSLAASLVRRV